MTRSNALWPQPAVSFRALLLLTLLLWSMVPAPAAALQEYHDPHNPVPRAVIPPDIAPEATQYFRQVQAHILPHIPASACHTGEWIQFEIKIDMRGRVGHVSPHAWAASKSCYAAAAAAIIKHDPLPAPPKALRDLLWRGGLIFTFTAQPTPAARPSARPAPTPPVDKPIAHASPPPTPLDQYRAQVTRQLLTGWQSAHCRHGEVAVFQMHIRADGTMTKIRKISPAPVSTACEESALLAINRASPLPAPPAGIAPQVLREQFRVTFRR